MNVLDTWLLHSVDRLPTCDPTISKDPTRTSTQVKLLHNQPPFGSYRNHVRGFQHTCMIWQNSSAKGASAQDCQLENHRQDLALKKMNKKHLLCTTQWVALPQDIVLMYLLSEWQWQLQSQHWQQCISTPTASDLPKPTSFESVIASKKMQCNAMCQQPANVPGLLQWIVAQEHKIILTVSLWNSKLLSKDGPDFKQFPNRFAERRWIDCAQRSCCKDYVLREQLQRWYAQREGA